MSAPVPPGHRLGVRIVLVAFAALITAQASPFRILSAANLRADATSNWAGFSTTHGTVVPIFGSIPTTDPNVTMLVYGGNNSATIWNAPGRNQSGVLLSHSSASDSVFFYPPSYLQGFGVTLETFSAGPATFAVDAYTGEGFYVDTKTISVADGRVPTFLGMVDPNNHIGIMAVRCLNGGTLAISNVRMQFRKVPTTDPASLPIAGTFTRTVEPMSTYLHQGYANVLADPPTIHATVDNANACDLLASFPTLRGGDVLAMSRLGSPLGSSGAVNALLGVLSTSDVITGGGDLRRVPGAVPAGTAYHTSPVSGGISTVITPTNLEEDFVISAPSYIVVPSGARYLFLSRATPEPGLAPMSITVNHVPRQVFEAWIASFGLIGSLAQPDSDLDGDGLTLLQEFAFGKDPTAQDATERNDYAFTPDVEINSSRNGLLRLLYGARTDGPIRYTAEVTSDLHTWQTLPDSAISPLLIDTTGQTRSVFVASDPTPGPKRFGRLRLQYLPTP